MTAQADTRVRGPVHEFDYIADPELIKDCHARYWRLKEEAPPVFWTPANGGHWVATTPSAIIHVVRHPETFSSRYLSIPPRPDQPKMIPEMLDPPEHRPYRQLLRPFFESKAIEPLEARVIELTEEVIGRLAPLGKCEFVEAVSSRLPVGVFMELFGFPLEQFEEFRALEVAFFNPATPEEERAGLAMQIAGHIAQLIQARMAEPRDDVFSKIIHSDFEGRTLAFDELMSIGFLMFLAGLDTVTNAMSFGIRHLAHDPDLQQRVIDDPSHIPNLVEELLRRYAFISVPRYIVEDVELEGARLKAGDCILAPLPLCGWDEHLNEKPEEVSIERQFYRHAAFGSGIHTCLGLHLARLELQVFYRVWFEKIGRFRLDPANPANCRGGSVMALTDLSLEWDV